jgi:hypothetical protein
MELEQQLSAGQVEEGVGLYHGDFLEGFFVRGSPGFEDWPSNRRLRRPPCTSRSRPERWSPLRSFARGKQRRRYRQPQGNPPSKDWSSSTWPMLTCSSVARR